jgi:hypothetical protein
MARTEVRRRQIETGSKKTNNMLGPVEHTPTEPWRMACCEWRQAHGPTDDVMDIAEVRLRGGRSGMKKSDVTCPECRAGYRRIELATHRVPEASTVA